MNFDPLIASNWDNISYSDLAGAKVYLVVLYCFYLFIFLLFLKSGFMRGIEFLCQGTALLEHFSRDIKKALSFAYPEIKFSQPIILLCNLNIKKEDLMRLWSS